MYVWIHRKSLWIVWQQQQQQLYYMPWNNQLERIYYPCTIIHFPMYTYIKVFYLFDLVRFGLAWFCVWVVLHSLLPFLSIIQIDIFINVWCLMHRSNHKRAWQGGKWMKEEERSCICVHVRVYSETKKRSWLLCCVRSQIRIHTHIRPLSDSEFSTRAVVFHMPISMMIMNGTHIVWQMIRVENPGVRYGWQKRRASEREKRQVEKERGSKECGNCQPDQQINY